MAELISKQRMKEILSPRNKDEKQKRRFVDDMSRRKVDIDRTKK